MIEVIDWTGAEATAPIENEEKQCYMYILNVWNMPISKKMLTVVEMTIEDLKIGMLDLNYARISRKSMGLKVYLVYLFLKMGH